MQNSNTVLPQISVIVPVYNSEKYLSKCIESILAQSFTDFECILVNDCSTDNSPEICDSYSLKDKRIKVIHNSENKGSSQSRKVGFNYSCGKYILFVDSDDWMAKEMFTELHSAIVQRQADIVYCDYYSYEEGVREYVRQKEYSDNRLFTKDIFSHTIGGYVWNKLVLRDLFQKIVFPVNFLYDDEVIMSQLLYYARQIGHVEKALYYYRYTKNKDYAIEDAYDNYKLIVTFLREKHGSDIRRFDPELSFRINKIKLLLFITCHQTDKKIFFDLYPESHRHIFNKLFFNGPMKSYKIMFFCIVHGFPIFPFRICIKVYRYFKKRY